MSERDRPGAAGPLPGGPPAEKAPAPRWREDFPIRWDHDHYVTRRELAKFLTLGSALLAAASAVIALVGKLRRPAAGPPGGVRVAASADIPAGGSVLFRFPTEEDPCILVRTRSGELRAFSQICTHLSCAVVHRAEDSELFCPCHRGHFSETDGLPTGGPPVRRLPVIRLEHRSDGVYAVGREV